MRGVSLLLVDMGRRRVDEYIVSGALYTVGSVAARCACHGHEVGGRSLNIQRIIRLQRHKNRAVAALVYQVKAMVEKLTKKGHVSVKRR